MTTLEIMIVPTSTGIGCVRQVYRLVPSGTVKPTLYFRRAGITIKADHYIRLPDIARAQAMYLRANASFTGPCPVMRQMAATGRFIKAAG